MPTLAQHKAALAKATAAGDAEAVAEIESAIAEYGEAPAPQPVPALQPHAIQPQPAPDMGPAPELLGSSTLGAVQRGVEEGATFGFRDKLGAFAGAAGAKVQDLMDDRKGRSFGDWYTEALAENQRETKAAEEAHPWAYGAGNVAGGVLTAAIPGAGLSGIAAKGASSATRLKTAATAGAKLGAAAGLGGSEDFFGKDGLGIGAARDLVTGGVVGGVGGAVGEKVAGAVASKVNPVLRKWADDMAMKSLGMTKQNLRSNLGGTGLVGGTEKAREIGRYLRDKGLVGPMTRPEGALKRIDAKREEVGAALGSILPDLDGKLAKAGLGNDPTLNADLALILKNVDDGIVQPLKREGTRADVSLADDIMDEAREMVKFANDDGLVPFDALHRFRVKLDRRLYWQGRDPATKINASELKKVRDVINDEIAKKVEAAGSVVGDGTEQATRADLNRAYSLLSAGEDIAEDGANRAMGNNVFSLTDVLAGGLPGGVTGGLAALSSGNLIPLGLTAAGLVGAKVARTYGPGISGSVANKGAKAFEPGGRALFYRTVRQLGPAGANELAEARGSDPEPQADPLQEVAALATQVPELQRAAQEGGKEGLAAANYTLSQKSPEFRKLKKELRGGTK
jgi:hypothetical protein